MLLPNVVGGNVEVYGVVSGCLREFVKFRQVCRNLTNFTNSLFGDANFIGYLFYRPARKPQFKYPLIPRLLRVLVNARKPFSNCAIRDREN